MSVVPSDYVVYGCANMPSADGVTVGGAVDFTKRLSFTDVSPSGFLDVVSSSGSDTATKLIYEVRDATGVPKQVTVTVNGTTPVTGNQTGERFIAAAITGGAIADLSDPGGTGAVGDIALYAHTALISAHTAQTGAANASGITPALFKLQAGDGASVAIGNLIRIKSNTGVNQLRSIIAITGYGTDVVAINRNWTTPPDNTSTYDIYQGVLFEILPNPVKAIMRLFATASADVAGGSARNFYQKGYLVNNNTATALNGAQAEISTNTPSLNSGAVLDLGMGASLNESLTIANRQTAPAGVSFTTQPAFVAVPGGVLPPGAAPNAAGAQPIWFRLALAANTAPYKGAATVLSQGATT